MVAIPDPTVIQAAQEEVLTYALLACHDGLVVSTAGNVSQRVDSDHIVVTPSGVSYRTMQPADLPVVRIDGTQVRGRLRPTSEIAMHLAMYRETRTEPVNAVVHTHAPRSTAASTLLDVVPNIHYALAACGGQIRVAPYATFGTKELADGATAAMRDRTACLLRNHGTLAVGPTLESAYDRTCVLEWTCDVWLHASAAGNPAVLDDDEYARVIDRLTTYGQPATDA